eukprot:g1545.t1
MSSRFVDASEKEDDDLYEGFNYNIDIGVHPPGTAQPNKISSSFLSNLDSKYDQDDVIRMATAARVEPSASDARPMTSINGAGYNSSSSKQRHFDPFNQGGVGHARSLAEIEENGPEAKANVMEVEVHRLVRVSAGLISKGEKDEALKRAKEAVKKERALNRFRESNNLSDSINLDLTYCVCFTLASAYEAKGMSTEALNTYTLVVKNKQYPHAGRLRVNMGNIYFREKKYLQAVKMYRMALDQIPATEREAQIRVLRNIGNSFVKLGQFSEAIESYERVMEESPDIQSGFNLVICHFAMGDVDKIKKSFLRLVSVPIENPVDEEAHDDDDDDDDDDDAMFRRRFFESGTLEDEIDRRKSQAIEKITIAAKLISPMLDKESWEVGFDWVVSTLEANHPRIASEMLITKALEFLRHKRFKDAIKVLKGFEKKEKEFMARAANNLSFLYFLEGDIEQADTYADVAVKTDRYNARALVNKGNCLYASGNLERAKEIYLESIGVDASCAEAIYNLGLVNKKLGSLKESLQAFEKLHQLIPSSPEVLYQIANLHDMMSDYRLATKWFNILITKVPSDPTVLSRLGQIYSKDDNETQAYHFHMDSYKYYPVNLDVISWLGVWFVKSEFYEKAIAFFERAAEIQPDEVKWRLMVTSCFRRMGNYQKALELYEAINRDYPENLECLRYLVTICKDLGMKYDHYQRALVTLERRSAQHHVMNTVRRESSSSTGRATGRGDTSAGAYAESGASRPTIDVHQHNDEDGPPSSTGAVSPTSPSHNESMDFDDCDIDDLLDD